MLLAELRTCQARLILHGAASIFGESQAYRLRGKGEILRGLNTCLRQSDLRSYQMLDPQVQVLGDTALLTYYYSETGMRDGKSFSDAGKISMVYVKQGGKWRVLHEHIAMNQPAPVSK